MTQLSNVEILLFVLIGINSLLIIWIMARVLFLEKSMDDKMSDIREILRDIRDDHRDETRGNKKPGIGGFPMH